MNIKNSQIRAHARRLLDDNIFGKDWLKGVFVVLLMTLTHLALTEVFAALAGVITVALLVPVAAVESVVLEYIVIIVVYAMAMFIAFGLMGPLNVGVAAVYINLVRNDEKIRIKNFFCGFKKFVSSAVLSLMYTLVVTLWTLFFIVPGIYVAYSYALVFHVKSDNPTWGWKQCFDESERLMEGNRLKLFKLQISHLGWFIIGLAFVGVGALWAVPYVESSTAVFYEQVRLERGSR